MFKLKIREKKYYIKEKDLACCGDFIAYVLNYMRQRE